MDGVKKINILIIHYNTPELTECLIKSINKFVKTETSIYIFDNSDKYPFTYKQENIIYIDNTKGQLINFDEWIKQYPEAYKTKAKDNNFASAKHCYSVNFCMSIIKNGFILMDSDILLKKDISNIADENYCFVGEVYKQYNGPLRVTPFLCYINTEYCKHNNIEYFNENKMLGLHENTESYLYDTGRYFYTLCEKHKHKKINIYDYIVHYRSGSWDNKNETIMGRKVDLMPNVWLENNRPLWNDEKIIVSMTTWTKRIKNIPEVVKTIINQTLLPDKIIINLSIEEFPEKEISLPDEINNFIKQNRIVEINWVDKNIRQWKKTIPTMLRFPNDCIICIDDDRLYPQNFIEILWEAHLKHPNNPVGLMNYTNPLIKKLQHTGIGTLDKLEYYNGFKDCLSDDLYKLASSDTFFTIISNKYGHPYMYCGVNIINNIKIYNEICPLRQTEQTCSIISHKKMQDFLIDKNIINNETFKENIITSENKKEILQKNIVTKRKIVKHKITIYKRSL